MSDATFAAMLALQSLVGLFALAVLCWQRDRARRDAKDARRDAEFWRHYAVIPRPKPPARVRCEVLREFNPPVVRFVCEE